MIVFKGNNGDDMDVFGKQTCSRLRKCSFTAFFYAELAQLVRATVC